MLKGHTITTLTNGILNRGATSQYPPTPAINGGFDIHYSHRWLPASTCGMCTFEFCFLAAPLTQTTTLQLLGQIPCAEHHAARLHRHLLYLGTTGGRIRAKKRKHSFWYVFLPNELSSSIDFSSDLERGVDARKSILGVCIVFCAFSTGR